MTDPQSIHTFLSEKYHLSRLRLVSRSEPPEMMPGKFHTSHKGLKNLIRRFSNGRRRCGCGRKGKDEIVDLVMIFDSVLEEVDE